MESEESIKRKMQVAIDDGSLAFKVVRAYVENIKQEGCDHLEVNHPAVTCDICREWVKDCDILIHYAENMPSNI